MNFIRFWLQSFVLMAKVALPWEIAFVCSFPILLTLAALPTHGMSRLVSSVLVLLSVVDALGCLFIIDNVYNRADSRRQ
jgi:hypothetical protein